MFFQRSSFADVPLASRLRFGGLRRWITSKHADRASLRVSQNKCKKRLRTVILIIIKKLKQVRVHVCFLVFCSFIFSPAATSRFGLAGWVCVEPAAVD